MKVSYPGQIGRIYGCCGIFFFLVLIFASLPQNTINWNNQDSRPAAHVNESATPASKMSGNGALVRAVFTSGIFKGYISAANSEDQFIACDDSGPDAECGDLDDAPDFSAGGDFTKHFFYQYDDLIRNLQSTGQDRLGGLIGIENVIFTTGPPPSTGSCDLKLAAPETTTSPYSDNLPHSITLKVLSSYAIAKISSASSSFCITFNKIPDTTRLSNNILLDFRTPCVWNIRSRHGFSLSIQKQEEIPC